MSCKKDSREISARLGELELLQSGVTVCDPGHSYGPVSYPNHAIHFNTKGKCRYILEDVEYEIGAGEGFIICPGQVNTYVADSDDPCTFNYITFRGSVGEELLRAAGLDENNVTFRFELGGELSRLLEKLHARCHERITTGYDIIGDFILIMNLLAESSPESRSSGEYIEKAQSFIESHYPYGLTTSELAAHIGVERSYLYRLFVSRLGQSPSDYVSDFRLKKALALMEEGLPLTVIALSTGFCDLSHFTKKFVARYGITPGEYRRKNQ